MIKMVTQISNKVPATQAIITGNVDDLFPLAGLTGGLVIKAVMVPDVLVIESKRDNIVNTLLVLY